MSTSLGLPAPLPPGTSAPTFQRAWDDALYGPRGFFRRESPAEHFRTSVHATAVLAEALVALCREAGLDTVVDVGAGRGELLSQLHALDPALGLLGVELAPRPRGLPEGTGWTPDLPARLEGLVFANEWLDNVPCHVVEVDEAGNPRLVHIDPASGSEWLGAPLDDPAVPAGLTRWCRQWWPLDGAEPGTRAEIGSSRDDAWADVLRRLTRGVAVAADYGHTRAGRPPLGSLQSFRDGRQVPVRLDGSCDVSAHVAVDSVARAAGGLVTSQREALLGLGVDASRPPLAMASDDPASYVRALSGATEAAELLDRDGLGAFSWVVSTVGVDGLAWPAR